MREQYWNFYVSLKHKACYYKYFQILLTRINWCISAVCTLLSISCVVAWGIWETCPLLWSVLICAAQVVQALFPKMPYNDSLVSCKFIIPEIEKLLFSVHHDWLSIQYLGKCSDKRIAKLIKKYDSAYSELVLQFFSADFLPVNKWCEKKAETECKNYFSTKYFQ